jgi:hypothetical protein
VKPTKNKEDRIMSAPEPDRAEPDPRKPPASKPDSPSPPRQESRTPAMAGLAIAVVLLVVGLWLARELRTASKMQDCLMSGRTNCNVIEP